MPEKELIHYIMRLIDYGKGEYDPELDSKTLGQIAEEVTAIVKGNENVTAK
jgi:hypothetical protein